MPAVTEAMTDLPTVARVLRRLREERGWTLAAASRAAGVSPQLLSMIEQGRRPNPTLDTLMALAAAYEVTLDDLAYDEPAIPPALQRVIESGLIGDVTWSELRQLRLARGLLGRQPDERDYYDLVELIRRRR